jgi:CHASE1-domain containing sensor protein
MRMTRTNLLSRRILPYLILLLGFCFTFVVYHYFSKLTIEQDRSRFDRSAQEIQDKVRLRIATSIALLRAGTGLFAASDSVKANEFQRFVQQIELEKNYKGVLGIGFARWSRKAEKAQVVILYLEPANPANQQAIGFDMAGEDIRRQAMEAARDSGKPTASGRVELVQEKVLGGNQKGFRARLSQRCFTRHGRRTTRSVGRVCLQSFPDR